MHAPQFRIASLVPSVTETLFELGLGSHLVARTGYCTHPELGVKAVAKVGGTKTVNLKKLAALKPTHVLLNRDENTLATLAGVQALNPAVQVLTNHPQCPLDNIALIRELGEQFNVQAQAERLCQRFELELGAVKARHWRPCRVLYLIWQHPWMTVASNTYISQTLALFGLHTYPNAVGEWVGASRYPVVADLAVCLVEHGIEAVLLSSEPYAFTQADCTHLHMQLGVPVHRVDGELTSWYGSRAVLALPALSAWTRSVFNR